jgi:hypothetical protein
VRAASTFPEIIEYARTAVATGLFFLAVFAAGKTDDNAVLALPLIGIALGLAILTEANL